MKVIQSNILFTLAYFTPQKHIACKVSEDDPVSMNERARKLSLPHDSRVPVTSPYPIRLDSTMWGKPAVQRVGAYPSCFPNRFPCNLRDFLNQN